MGLEAECTVRVGRKNSAGKALLEGEAIVFRGDFRVELPFERIREVIVTGNSLVVRTVEQEVRFELGAAVAERWMRLIKEPKGLLEKLEVVAQSRIAVVGVRDAPFLNAIREHAASVVEGRVPEGAPIVFFGVESRDALNKIPLLRARMAETGTLWVVRPKGSKVVSEAEVFAALRAAGLVDTKVVAFSRTHTAHKSVIPLELRGKGIPRPPIVSLPPGARPPEPKAPADEPKARGQKSAKIKVAKEATEPAARRKAR